jgi:hypothetical protein
MVKLNGFSLLGQNVARSLRAPDALVILTWLLIVVVLAACRVQFTGDGLRHLPELIKLGGPSLGEPRWLLTPGLLWILIHPWVALGWISTVEGAIPVFQALTLVSGLSVMIMLRAELEARGYEPVTRAAALTLAGASPALVLFSSDTLEPLFPAAVCVAGLCYAGRCSRAGHPARGILAALAAIVFGSLFYQGVLLAVFLLPCFVPIEAFRHSSTLIRGAAILALAPLTLFACLLVSGNSPGHAIEQVIKGGENPLYLSYLKKPWVQGIMVAAIAGPPQGVSPPPAFIGIKTLIAELREPEARKKAFGQVLRFALGWLVLGTILAAAVRLRIWSLPLAVAGILLLPVVLRYQQYGYNKYYALFPVVLALGAVLISTRKALVLGGLVAMANLLLAFAELSTNRELYQERESIFKQFDSQDCWFNSGWGPDFDPLYRWPGQSCSVLERLSGGKQNDSDSDSVIRAAHQSLTECIATCFCSAKRVVTSDMVDDGSGGVIDVMVHFTYSAFPTKVLLLGEHEGQLVSPSRIRPTYVYPAAKRQAICDRARSMRP